MYKKIDVFLCTHFSRINLKAEKKKHFYTKRLIFSITTLTA